MKQLLAALVLAPVMAVFSADQGSCGAAAKPACTCGAKTPAECKCGAACSCASGEVKSYNRVKLEKACPFLTEMAGFLEKNNTLYLATVENGEPRVRPFRYTMILDNQLAIATSVKKGMAKQMEANPNVEIATASSDGKMFLRFAGQAKRCTDQALVDAFLKKCPKFGKMFGADFALFLVQPANVGLFPNKPGALPKAHKFTK